MTIYGAAACVESVLSTYSTRTIAINARMIKKIETIPNKQTLHTDIILSEVKKNGKKNRSNSKSLVYLTVNDLRPCFAPFKKRKTINCQRSKSYSDSIDESENVNISKVNTTRCFSPLTAIIYPVVLDFVLAVRVERCVRVECLFS